MARRKAKKNTTDINIKVVLLIVISIILAILIYTKSGYIGENLTPVLRRINRLGKIHCTTWYIVNCSVFGT